jgi:Toxin with inhibitor cystine knot ICK or Knottin scaffold
MLHKLLKFSVSGSNPLNREERKHIKGGSDTDLSDPGSGGCIARGSSCTNDHSGCCSGLKCVATASGDTCQISA